MKYKESEVLDILKQFTDKPKKAINQWNINKSNTPPTEELSQYVYSFPVIINDAKVATITLANVYHIGVNNDDIMQKYFGHKEYKKTWDSFSHDTYLFCYLTIHRTFSLNKIVKGFYGQTITAKDALDVEFTFDICYGSPDKEKDIYIFEEWARSEKSYSFDNGVSVKFDKPKNGWRLGDKINENIKSRLRNQTIDSIIQ